jgi:predicted esterase
MRKVDSFDQLRDELMRFYEAGSYSNALEIVEANESNFPEMSARTTFWKMCLHSLEGNLNAALSIFRKGLDDGLWWAESQFNDTDLDSLRDLPEFKKLVVESVQRWEQERTQIKRDHVLLLPDASRLELYPLLVVLHGRNGNKESNLRHWETARRKGWAILSPQSTQPLFPGSYCWDDLLTGVQDILFHLENTLKAYKIDRERIVIGGFSQGSGMAICTALHPEVPISGFIGVGTWWANVDSIAALAKKQKQTRGYFISGEKDYTLDRSREIKSVLETNGISCIEEIHTELRHEFPTDFEKSFTQAIEFIFEE